MSQRKPPSQRPERKMDAVAEAIAREAQEAKARKKSDDESSPGAGQTRKPQGRLAAAAGAVSRKVDAAPVYPSTKKPKKV